jgi:transitional endoplasmic reticulum ATPase
MTKGPALTTPSYINEYDAEVSVWLTRIVLSNPIAIKQLSNSIYTEELRTVIGVKPTEGKISTQAFLKLSNALRARADDIATSLKQNELSCELDINLTNLVTLLGLDAIQYDILKLLVIGQHHILLRDMIDQLNINSPDEMVRVLAVALNSSIVDMNRAIYSKETGLITKKLVTLSIHYLHGSTQFKVSSDIYKVLFMHHDSVNAMMESFIELASASKLIHEDFTHLQQEAEIVSTYFTEYSKHQTGMNVLIYGPTGTGKTEFVKWLSSHLGKQLYAVKSEDADSASITGNGRMAFYQISQQFLKQSNAIILFDEIEDVFPNQDAGEFGDHHKDHSMSKAWLNHILESNPVPTIWVSNAIHQIDKAYLRRFDFSIEIGIPPLDVRKRILNKYLGPLHISDATIERYAQKAWLSPAQIERAAHVLSTSNTPLHLREHNLNLILGNSMKLLNQSETTVAKVKLVRDFELAYVNADQDLAELVSVLKSKPDLAANICLHGEPGTGKTSFAHYVAKQLQRPLMAKHAAELLSPYVGETEQNMMQAFKEAEQEKAVLLIDEADSFISSRSTVNHRWEVTQINQMLSLMESFQGILICSTNRLTQLDDASMRRFTYKVRFDGMTAEQRWLMFNDMFKDLTAEQRSTLRPMLNQLDGLSLGDFATVKKQSQLAISPLSPLDWINKLKAEIDYKPSNRKPTYGFIK